MYFCCPLVFIRVAGANKHSIFVQAHRQECVTENYFSYLSTKAYVVVTLKNCLNKTDLFRFRLLGKKIIAILRLKCLLN